MQIQAFCSKYNLVCFGILIIISEITSLNLGWITFTQQSIITSPFCTYYMIGNTMCPLFFNGFNTRRMSYKQCYQFDSDCKQANEIRNVFIAAQSLTHSLFILLLLFKFVFKMRFCIKVVWIMALLASLALYCYDAIIIEKFANESKNSVNLIIKDYIWGLFGFRLFQLICFVLSQISIPPPIPPNPYIDPNPNIPPIVPPPGAVKPGQIVPIIIDDEEYFRREICYNPIDEDMQIR